MTIEEFKKNVTQIEENTQYKRPLALALGIRRQHRDITLDVHFPHINFNNNFGSMAIISKAVNFPQTNGFFKVDKTTLKKIWEEFAPFHNELDKHTNVEIISQLKEISNESSNSYSQTDVIAYFLFDKDKSVESAEEAYFKLNCLSQRCVTPHSLSLEGAFGKLTNIAWTNQGPILPKDLTSLKTQFLLKGKELSVTHVDKFPYLTNYFIPSGVRIASSSQVRLGAYLGEGTTVMPAGYVNFNAGTEGNAMVEGRVSAGVFIKKDSDIGGGASIMGTLSGGNKHIIQIGEKCLIGANAGTGISLGDKCTIAAGLYIYGGMKVSLYDQKEQPVDLDDNFVKEGDNIVKAYHLSGKNNMLFIQDSQSGKVICKPNKKVIELNSQLHHN